MNSFFCKIVFSIFFTTVLLGAGDAPKVDPETSLKKLMDGNARYVAAKESSPKEIELRRSEVAKGQHPFAVIVACSDSRVAPEIIFDQNLGDLFVIRVAGNVVNDHVIGSIEYAVEHLGSSLVMVVGHERCGAVAAATEAGSSKAPGHIESILDQIEPAVKKAKNLSGDLVDNSVKENALLVGDKLKHSKPILAEKVEQGKIRVVEGYYDLDTGKVSILQPAKP